MASTDTKPPPPEDRFKANLLSLANIMKKEINNARSMGIETVSGSVVELGISLIKGTPSATIIGGFISRSFPVSTEGNLVRNVWDEVYKENDDFFLNNSSVLFGELSEGIVNGFKVLLVNESYRKVNPALMTTIWKHLVAMVKTSLHFIYSKREPLFTTSSEGYIITYQKAIYPQIKLEEEAKRWNVNLMS
jgi:hypothetical protein